MWEMNDETWALLIHYSTEIWAVMILIAIFWIIRLMWMLARYHFNRGYKHNRRMKV